VPCPCTRRYFGNTAPQYREGMRDFITS